MYLKKKKKSRIFETVKPNKSGPAGRKKRNLVFIYIVSGLIIILLIAVIHVLRRPPGKPLNVTSLPVESPVPGKQQQQSENVSDGLENRPEATRSQGKTDNLPRKRGRFVIIVDDVGYKKSDLVPFLQLQAPLVFAVLPNLPYSTESAQMIHRAGKTVIIHMPMEPEGTSDPGPGAITAGMSEIEVIQALDTAVGTVPYAVGMNNHMGSKITADTKIMKIVMKYLAKSDMFFIDSRTTSDSVVFETAKEAGVPVIKRDIFLDNEDTKEYVVDAMNQGKDESRKKGNAVMIGHIWSNQLADTINEMYSPLIDEGYTIEDISKFILQEGRSEYTGD